MLIGISYDEYWNGDYTKFKYYEEAYKLEIERKNQELWMQGLYFYEGITTALSNAFAKKGSKPQSYPDKPHRITSLTEEEKEEEKRKQVEEFRKQLMMLDKHFTAKHSKDKVVSKDDS